MRLWKIIKWCRNNVEVIIGGIIIVVELSALMWVIMNP